MATGIYHFTDEHSHGVNPALIATLIATLNFYGGLELKKAEKTKAGIGSTR